MYIDTPIWPTNGSVTQQTNKKKREGGRKGSPAPLPPFISLRFFFSSNLSVSEASGNQGGKMGGGGWMGPFPPSRKPPPLLPSVRTWALLASTQPKLSTATLSATQHDTPLGHESENVSLLLSMNDKKEWLILFFLFFFTLFCGWVGWVVVKFTLRHPPWRPWK